ncbi:hypothetical protein K501DRAFT_331484 [Backusella circina FSU 941]|nr:hypothetical protein K501DRAFT_331484 [Backusella circina FSU 941]
MSKKYLESVGLILPEINLTKQEDWDDMILLSSQDQSSESKSSGLTRTLSLPRIVKDEDNNSVTEVINISTSNPSHLFWVPASQHPEISPAEFQKYVETHGLNIKEKGAKQRQSVLSVSFTPGDDLVEESTSSNDNEMERKMALDALERMNNIRVNSEQSLDEPNKKLLLRRSVSLHFPKGDYHEIPDFLVFDRNSSPLDQSQALVPKGDRPLLRRGARNNFKRNLSVISNHSSAIINRKSESDFIQQQQQEKQKQHIPTPLVRSASAEGNTSQQCRERLPKPIVPIIVEEPPSPQVDTFDKHQCRDIQHDRQTRKTWSWAFWSDEKSKKKDDPSSLLIAPVKPRPSKSSEPSFSGKRFAFSHLFSRKTKSSLLNTITSPDPPKDFQLNRMLMSRLPLHMERAVYKLSHMKLANPRRPLHEQVLISNHMFWYLSIISSTSETMHPVLVKSPRKLVKKTRSTKKKIQIPQQPQRSNEDSLPSFMKSHSVESTGFVVPDNYLNPQNGNTTGVDMDGDPESLQDNIPLAMYKSYRKKL